MKVFILKGIFILEDILHNSKRTVFNVLWCGFILLRAHELLEFCEFTVWHPEKFYSFFKFFNSLLLFILGLHYTDYTA